MLKKENFFKNYSNSIKNHSVNIKKTKKAFNSLVTDLKNNKIPLLKTYEKDYKFSFSKKVIKKFYKYENIIIFGIGGSALGAKSIYSFFKKKIKKKVFFFDNLDPNLNNDYKKIKNLKNSCFILISKSGNTLETIVNFGIVFSKNIQKRNLIVITESANNTLMAIASKYKAELIEHKNFIGGRYSVLSETGMFPSALMGLNLSKFKNLKRLIKNKKFVSSLIQNVASIYSLNKRKISNSIILNYDTSLNDFGLWYQQLVAESLGKKGRGIYPILSSAPKDHHSLLQLYLDGPKDKFFTFINSPKEEKKLKFKSKIIPTNYRFLKSKNIEFFINAQYKAVKNIFRLKKIPFREITFKNRNEEELGEFFTFFVLETILLSRLMNVNPFNQPAVELVKIETKKILG